MKTLKTVLLVNGVSSGATGLALVVMPGFFADLFDTSSRAPFMGTGIFLIAFAMLVLFEWRRQDFNPGTVRLITALDALWVMGSVFILVTGVFAISTLGYLMIGAVAAWVALMAYLQFVSLKKTLLSH